LPEATVLALSRADQALGRLVGIGELLPNPHVMVQPYIRREAVASTRIEGTQSSLGEVLAAEAQLQLLPETPDVREVLNYVRAFERGLGLLPTLPVSARLLREMHSVLLHGVRGGMSTPGEFRRSQNWIGGRSPSDALFVPPPPLELPNAISDFERFLHDENVPLPVLVRCALLHYQFETIHPFVDGNGRLGRLLVIFYLVERGVLREPLLYLSGYLESHRDEYVSRLQAVREEGDYESWVTFFLTAVEHQAEAAIETAEALLTLQRSFRERLRRSNARGQALDIADRLIANPFVSAPRIAVDFGISRQGALYVLKTLERAGVVQRSPSAGRRVLYVAREVLEALEEPPATGAGSRG
jgi:Fic family protein